MKPTVATALSVAGVLAAGALAIAANTAVFAEPDMAPVSGVTAEDVDPTASVEPAGTVTLDTAGTDDREAGDDRPTDRDDGYDDMDESGDDGHDDEAEEWDDGELDDD